MVNSFVSRFLLPLVKGGPLHVARPLGHRAVVALHERHVAMMASELPTVIARRSDPESTATDELGRLRRGRARALIYDAPEPPLDLDTIRLGVAVHNVLALAHPDLVGRGLERRQQRIAEVTEPIADLGPPRTMMEAVNRHTLLSRLPELTRTEHTVEFWAGRRHFVGRVPPGRVLALPRLRRVNAGSLRRLWFKEIGVPACGERAWIAVLRASPFGEALDPLRLSPPFAWDRVLPVLQFPRLCRIVVGRVLELGLETAGAAMVPALLRFGSGGDGAGEGPPARPAEIAFAIRFLAHAFWMQHLYGGSDAVGAASDLGALMAAAADVDLRLVWPADVDARTGVGESFSNVLAGLRAVAPGAGDDRYAALSNLARVAVGGGAAYGSLRHLSPPLTTR